MLAELRSELIRTRRKGALLGWAGLTAVFAGLVDTVMFRAAEDTGTDGPGVRFPSAAELAGSDGLVAGLAAASNLFGVVTLSFWAIFTATDYSTGLVRLLVSTQPRRWRLVAGKLGALALWTVAASLVAVAVDVAAAPAAARSAGVDTGAWSASAVSGAWLDLLGAQLVWGVLGFLLATATRSAAVAVSAGVGYVLLLEPVVASVAGSVADVLPGSTLSALAAGGSDALSRPGAVGLGVAYALVGVGVALVVVVRRDVTD